MIKILNINIMTLAKECLPGKILSVYKQRLPRHYRERGPSNTQIIHHRAKRTQGNRKQKKKKSKSQR